MCHSIPLGAHVLGLKTRIGRDWSIIKLKMGLQPWKKHCEGEHSNIWRVYVNEISFQRYIEKNPFEK